MELVYCISVALLLFLIFRGLEARYQDSQTETVTVRGKVIPYANRPDYYCLIFQGDSMSPVSKEIFDSVLIGDEVLKINKTLKLGSRHFKIYDFSLAKKL